jgi:hypothetical protein
VLPRSSQVCVRYPSRDTLVLELILDHETPSGPLAEVSAAITRSTDVQGGTASRVQTEPMWSARQSSHSVVEAITSRRFPQGSAKKDTRRPIAGTS